MKSASNSGFPAGSVYRLLSSPVGELLLVASDKGLHWVGWAKEINRKGLEEGSHHQLLVEAAKQLDEYFDGKRRVFDLPLAPEGTAFQKRAWQQLRRIPYGRTISYREQARRLGDVRKARAVGGANARNPLAVIVPCHRVVANDGSLGGFGGGVRNKKYLLELENAIV